MYIFILVYTLLFQPAPLTIVSPDFANDGNIPARFTCDGENVNPTIIINGIPEGTKSLTLVVEAPSSSQKPLVQWVVWNIKPTDTILENTIPGIEGINSAGKNHYAGPCPSEVSQYATFKVFALDTLFDMDAAGLTPKTIAKIKIDEVMTGHILGTGELRGEYNRSMATKSKGK